MRLRSASLCAEALGSACPPVRRVAPQVQLRTFSGSGTDEDIVCSSTRAYVNAINKMIGCAKRLVPVPGIAISRNMGLLRGFRSWVVRSFAPRVMWQVHFGREPGGLTRSCRELVFVELDKCPH